MPANKKQKDEMMAKYMAEHPGQFPDSVMRPWNGEGAGIRAMARSMGSVPNTGSTWERGMLGGIVAAKLGLASSAGIPPGLLE